MPVMAVERTDISFFPVTLTFNVHVGFRGRHIADNFIHVFSCLPFCLPFRLRLCRQGKNFAVGCGLYLRRQGSPSIIHFPWRSWHLKIRLCRVGVRQGKVLRRQVYQALWDLHQSFYDVFGYKVASPPTPEMVASTAAIGLPNDKYSLADIWAMSNHAKPKSVGWPSKRSRTFRGGRRKKIPPESKISVRT